MQFILDQKYANDSVTVTQHPAPCRQGTALPDQARWFAFRRGLAQIAAFSRHEGAA
jgi:hypothetical protein